MGIMHKPLPEDVRGSVEGLVIIKHRFGKTIISAFPDMSKIVFSNMRKVEQRRFSDAVAYAKAIVSNAATKAAYQAKLPVGKKVFNAAISDYMKGSVGLAQNSSDSVKVQLSYAQKLFLANMNRSRPESNRNKDKSDHQRALNINNF